MLHAPSPPRNRSSSLGYMGNPDLDEEERHSGRFERRRRRRQRSRSRSWEDEQREAKISRPGDELSVIERHGPEHREDYDWYDDGGMRVRVREI